ncbi:MAG: hypothetical protein H6601_01200 [Flavobacteriales bacterium]|nr:hypothetical protein [Flavobacteriales bacterium]
MKKKLFALGLAAFTLSTVSAVAQDKTATENSERTVENKQKEADALKQRIEQYTIKVEANKDNAKVNYEAEMVKLQELKTKWESLTGKEWVDEKKKK